MKKNENDKELIELKEIYALTKECDDAYKEFAQIPFRNVALIEYRLNQFIKKYEKNSS